jgi:hypothetical protein
MENRREHGNRLHRHKGEEDTITFMGHNLSQHKERRSFVFIFASAKVQYYKGRIDNGL